MESGLRLKMKLVPWPPLSGSKKAEHVRAVAAKHDPWVSKKLTSQCIVMATRIKAYIYFVLLGFMALKV
jgi:hypothetical protein